MTKQVRDWQEDMELASRQEFANRDMAIHWLGQYAEASNEVCYWKGEAESAQREVHLLTMQNEDLKRLYAAENERADQLETHFQDFIKIAERWSEDLCKAEAREKKLREAIEAAIADIDHEAFRTACNGLEDALASLYPDKEEEQHE